MLYTSPFTMSASVNAMRRSASSVRSFNAVASTSRSYASASKSAPAPTSASSPSISIPEIHLGATHQSRYAEHYDRTIASDLMYMTYNHRSHSTETIPEVLPEPQTAYELNRPTPPLRGNRPARPSAKTLSPATIPKLESIVLHTMVKEAIGNKQSLLSAIMALRAISGQSPNGGGRSGNGVEVIVSRTGAAAFKLRAGMPVAVKVEMKGEAMYDFIQSLVDFVIPRIREYPGIALPALSASKTSPSAVGGVVSFGLPHTAMGLFPQIEANLDSYPRLHGFHMYFKTSAKGDRAQEHAEALLSGFRIPFHRR